MTTGQPALYAYPDIPSLSRSLRSYILTAQTLGLSRHGIFKIGVSGGSLPKVLAAALLPEPTGPDDVIQWGKWEIFFADERAVGLEHEDSNYGLLKTELLDKIPGDGRPVVHAIDTDVLNDVQELADRYEQLLVRSFASRYDCSSSLSNHNSQTTKREIPKANTNKRLRQAPHLRPPPPRLRSRRTHLLSLSRAPPPPRVLRLGISHLRLPQAARLAHHPNSPCRHTRRENRVCRDRDGQTGDPETDI